MAEQIQPDYNLFQQLAFLQNGGKLPGTSSGEQFQQGASLVGKIGNDVNSLISGVLANKKAALDQKRVGEIFGIPTAQQAAGQQSTRVAPNIFPQPQASGPVTKEGIEPQSAAMPNPAPIAPGIQERQQFQERTGIPADTPMFQVKELLPELLMKQKFTTSPEVLPVSALPAEAKARALAAGFTEDGMIDLKKFNALKTVDPYAPVQAMTPQQRLDAGMAPGNIKVVNPEDGKPKKPTYKKSELLKMSPEERATLGEYKTVDDIATNKATEDNQVLDSVLQGINNLSNIRSKMSSAVRGATLIPGGATAAKLFSAPLTEWETEKNLLAQRLGKLVEKNRMSDEDRAFYMRLFNSPASSDEAFDANINSLKTSISTMKKSTPMQSNSNLITLPDGSTAEVITE